jgi:tripartite-type tricarboxylate transporter receptor subunit TctC
MATLGVEPVAGAPEEFGATVLRDMARWFEFIKRGGVQPQ